MHGYLPFLGKQIGYVQIIFKIMNRRMQFRIRDLYSSTAHFKNRSISKLTQKNKIKRINNIKQGSNITTEIIVTKLLLINVYTIQNGN